MSKTFIIGVAGGSCSGKTTLANCLHLHFGTDHCSLIKQDSYYIDQSKSFDRDGGAVNFDHPSAIDFNLLAQHIIDLKNGKIIKTPQYDFTTHPRLDSTFLVNPMPVIIIDGTLIFNNPEVRELMDYKIFIAASKDLRLARRLKRDTEERGRKEAGVIEQFEAQVEPMHQEYVETSSNFSDYILQTEDFTNGLNQVIKNINISSNS